MWNGLDIYKSDPTFGILLQLLLPWVHDVDINVFKHICGIYTFRYISLSFSVALCCFSTSSHLSRPFIVSTSLLNEVRTWLFKIDDERSSRGTAYIDLLKMQQVKRPSDMLAEHGIPN